MADDDDTKRSEDLMDEILEAMRMSNATRDADNQYSDVRLQRLTEEQGGMFQEPRRIQQGDTHYSPFNPSMVPTGTAGTITSDSVSIVHYHALALQLDDIEKKQAEMDAKLDNILKAIYNPRRINLRQ